MLSKVALGRTGLHVSRLCFGSLTISPLQANLELDKGVRLLMDAYDLGVNFIDTGHTYRSYSYIRELIKQTDEHIVVCSKSFARDYDAMRRELEFCLAELDVDCVDIFMEHATNSLDSLRDRRDAYKCLLKAKEEGLIKAAGISTHSVEVMRAIATDDDIDAIHPLVNIDAVGILHGSRDEMLEQIRIAHERGKGIFAMKPFGGGMLHKRAEQALKFLANIPEIDSIAVGIQRKDELLMNAAILTGRTVSTEMSERLGSYAKQILIEDHCKGCGTCVERCDSGALSVSNGMAVVDRSKCILCGYCGAVCSSFAIKIV
ncbi:MAG: aldo/keto reductase [Armatimonadota bacterium]|nr:aldo/keto reductase [Armatimonadota bacterium]